MSDARTKKDIGSKLQAIQAVATTGAIIIGGFWTYRLFIEQRQQYAHLKIEHNVKHVSLPDHRILLILDVAHSNVGTVKVSLTSADIQIYALRNESLTDEEINEVNGMLMPSDQHKDVGGAVGEEAESHILWESVAERHAKWQPESNRFLEALAKLRNTWKKPDAIVVEPGETNQLHYEFVLSDDSFPLLIFTYFKNPTVKDRDIGWETRSLYDPRKQPEAGPKPQPKHE